MSAEQPHVGDLVAVAAAVLSLPEADAVALLGAYWLPVVLGVHRLDQR